MTLIAPPQVTTEDGFRRRVSYLRISLTDRCNLSCGYCMPKGRAPLFPRSALLSTAEIKRLIGVFRSLGVTKVRLTGGEPLLRPDVEEILSHLTDLGVGDVSLTTNGLLLKSRLPALLEAGLKRINVSLDTFRPELFHRLTGSDSLDRVLAGLEAVLRSGMRPIKINMVVMKGWNLEEIPRFVSYAESHPVEVRFLELMPTRNNFEGTAPVEPEAFVPVEAIRALVEQRVKLGRENPIGGVARSYPILGGQGAIGFVSPVSNHFCGTCNRVRLTSTGGLKTCLHGQEAVNLGEPLRRGASDLEIAQLIREALFRKPEEHFIRPGHFVSPHLQMSRVGG